MPDIESILSGETAVIGRKGELSFTGRGSRTSVSGFAMKAGAFEYRHEVCRLSLKPSWSSIVCCLNMLDLVLEDGNLEAMDPDIELANAMSFCKIAFASWKMFAICTAWLGLAAARANGACRVLLQPTPDVARGVN